MLQAFGNDIWIVDGPKVRFFVADLPTRMIVVRLGDGSLWINSPVEVSAETLDEVRKLGPVRHLVSPTRLHRWRLDHWHALFPEARLWDSLQLTDESPECWSADLDQVVFRGNALASEVEFFHKASRTLIVADFIQNYRARPGDAIGTFIKRAAGVLDGGVPLDIRLSFTDKANARRSLEKIMAWDFQKLIIAHGACIEHDAGSIVRNAFGWLGAK